MARRKLKPLTFRGIGLTTKGRTAYFEYDEGGYNSPRHDAITVDKQGNFPSFLRLQPEGKIFPLRIAIKSEAKLEQFNAIAKIFDPTLGENFLVLEDNSCTPARQFRLLCAPQQIILEQRTDSAVIVPLYAADPILLSLNEVIQTDNIDNVPTNPITFSVRNDGTYPSDVMALRVGANLSKLATQGHQKVIEVAYATRSEFSLTGPGSGTWLLNVAPTTWNTAALVTAGEIQADGRDIAVFVDEVQVPPEKVTLADFDTSDTKVWIEISDGPEQFGELSIAIVAGTTTFVFYRGDHGFRAGDYLTWINDAAATETARITSVNGNSIVVTRGHRNTTAGASAVDVRIYRSGHHIQLAYNYTGTVAVRPTNPDPPLINTTLSTNLQWEWTTSPMWSNDLGSGDRRPGGFRRILYNGREDVPELRKNRLATKTTLVAFGTTATFQDEEPSVLKPNFDAIEFTACCGIDDVLGAIEYDAAIDWPFAFQIIGRDLLGYDNIIFNHVGHGGAGSSHLPPAPLLINQQENPDGILSAVIFRARNMIVTSVRCADTSEESLTILDAVGEDAQTFTIDEDTQLIGIVARMRDAGATASGATVQIAETESGVPGDAIVGPFTGLGSMGNAFLHICFFPSAAAAFTTDIPILGAGEYALIMVETDGVPDVRIPKSSGSIYAKGSHYEKTSARPTYVGRDRIPDEDLWFAILSLRADNQEETLQQEHSGEFVVVDDIKLIFDPDRTPIVTPAAAEAAYYFDTTWEMNGDTIRLRWLRRTDDLSPSDLVEINPHDQTAFEDKFNDNIRAAITVSSDPWLEATPGDNTLTVTAIDGAEEERHIVAIRSAWLA